MKEEDPEFGNLMEEITKHLKNAFHTNTPYREIRHYLISESVLLTDKKVFRYHIDRIAIQLLGKDNAMMEILIDEKRIQEEGEEPTYPLYPGLYPRNFVKIKVQS